MLWKPKNTLNDVLTDEFGCFMESPTSAIKASNLSETEKEIKTQEENIKTDRWMIECWWDWVY